MKVAAKLGLFAVTLALTVTSATVSFAAPAEFESVDVTLLSEQGTSILLVAGKLPDSTKLPAEIQLSLPVGSELQWAGELVSQDGSGDFEVAPAKSSAEGADVYTMTLTKSRVGQVEATVPSATTFDGTTYVTSLTWMPTFDAPQARVSARVPAGAQIAQLGEGETGSLVPGDASNSYFTKTVEGVKAGTPVTMQFSYTVAAAPATTAAGDGSNGLVVALIIALALAVFALAFVAIRRKAASAAQDDYDEAEADYSDEDAVAPAHDVIESAEAPETDASDDETHAAPRSKAPVIILVGVIAVAIAVGAFAGRRSTTAQNLGGALARTYGTGEACTQASIGITPAQGVNLDEEGGTILSALEQVPGIGTATILADQGVIEIGYCDSSATEDDLRAVLTSTGLVQVAAASATPAAPSAEQPAAEATDAPATE